MNDNQPQPTRLINVRAIYITNLLRTKEDRKNFAMEMSKKTGKYN